MFPPDSYPAVDEVEEPLTAPAAEAASLSGRLPLAGGLLFASVAEAFLMLALALPGGSHLMLVQLGVPLMSGLFALGSCLLVSMGVHGRERAAWVVMGLSCLGVLVAQAARFAFQAQLSLSTLTLVSSYPSVVSVALIAQSAGLFLAFLLFPPPIRATGVPGRLRLLADGGLMMGTALVGAIYFLVLPLPATSSGTLTPARLTTLAICAGDLLLLTGLIFALRAIDQRRAPLYGALCVLGLAMLLLIGSDAASIIQLPDQPAPVNSWLQATWNAGYLCIGLGALLRLRGQGRSAAEVAMRVRAESGFWLILPVGLAIVMTGVIAVHMLTDASTSTQTTVALTCLSLLVVLIGIHHLAGLFEVRRIRGQFALLAQEADLATAEVEQLHASAMLQEQARQESLFQLQDVLAQFSQGEYQVRAGMLERELMPLGSSLNAFLDSVVQLLSERDRGREMRLLSILSDALGRLALGELHDLPDLPSPAGTGLEALVKGVVQVRTRLVNLQQSLHQYEAGRDEAELRLAMARHELEQEAQAQHQLTLEMKQSLESQLENERMVAQASESQRQRLEAQVQAAEAQVQAAEAQASAAEAALKTTEDLLLKERHEMERLRAERQALEERLRSIPQLNSASAAQLRKHGEQVVAQLTEQAERLHTAAATLQTASEVAHGLARSIEETAALPELQSRPPAEPVAPQAPTPVAASKRPLSAMQMLERMAGLRAEDTAPQPIVAPVPPAPPPVQQSGPLNETSGERVVRRLRSAATRAEEIAAGLNDLAKQCISAGNASLQAAEEANRLTADLERPVSAPGAPVRSSLPARSPRAGR